MSTHETVETFAPDPDFAAQANARAEDYERASADRLAVWDEQARRLDWSTEWSEVLDWSDAPVAKWDVGGTLNTAYNFVDRHVAAGNGDPAARHSERAPPDEPRDITYA